MLTIETPTPVVDLDRVEANLAKMQAYADEHGLKLRPHIKTHKIVKLAQRQLELGAVGITCQKLQEAEVMADAGITDILVSYPQIGPFKAARMAELAKRAEMTIAVDSIEGVQTAADAAKAAGKPIKILVEFDSGMKRTGVQTVEQATALAVAVSEHAGLVLEGLMTYPTTEKTAPFVAEAKKQFAEKGLEIRTVSSGGTPSAFQTHKSAGVTELRVGTYIFNDRMMMEAGVATLEDTALHLYATVVSRPTADRAIIDAGSKTFTSDMAGGNAKGHGLVLGYPDAIVERISEEHGMLDLSACAKKPVVGEVLEIVPNHVCPVVNLHDRLTIVQGGQVIGEWEVDARGLTR